MALPEDFRKVHGVLHEIASSRHSADEGTESFFGKFFEPRGMFGLVTGTVAGVSKTDKVRVALNKLWSDKPGCDPQTMNLSSVTNILNGAQPTETELKTALLAFIKVNNAYTQLRFQSAQHSNFRTVLLRLLREYIKKYIDSKNVESHSPIDTRIQKFLMQIKGVDDSFKESLKSLINLHAGQDKKFEELYFPVVAEPDSIAVNEPAPAPAPAPASAASSAAVPAPAASSAAVPAAATETAEEELMFTVEPMDATAPHQTLEDICLKIKADIEDLFSGAVPVEPYLQRFQNLECKHDVQGLHSLSHSASGELPSQAQFIKLKEHTDPKTNKIQTVIAYNADTPDVILEILFKNMLKRAILNNPSDSSAPIKLKVDKMSEQHQNILKKLYVETEEFKNKFSLNDDTSFASEVDESRHTASRDVSMIQPPPGAEGGADSGAPMLAGRDARRTRAQSLGGEAPAKNSGRRNSV